jgi:hypothetical protein
MHVVSVFYIKYSEVYFFEAILLLSGCFILPAVMSERTIQHAFSLLVRAIEESYECKPMAESCHKTLAYRCGTECP